MNLEDRLNKLSEINKVDAPQFLFTRIEQQIKNLQERNIKPVFKFAYAGLAILILSVNILVIGNYYQSEKKNSLEIVVQNMQLQSTNNLYHEQN